MSHQDDRNCPQYPGVRIKWVSIEWGSTVHFICWMFYSMDTSVCYPPFEQPGPDEKLIFFLQNGNNTTTLLLLLTTKNDHYTVKS